MLTRARADFLTDEQRMIRDTARDVARAELAPHAGDWEDQGWIPDEVGAKMGDLGLLGMTVPLEWGGTGADYVAYVLAVEEIAAGCAATSTMMSVQNGLGCSLVRRGLGRRGELRRLGVGAGEGELLGLEGQLSLELGPKVPDRSISNRGVRLGLGGLAAPRPRQRVHARSLCLPRGAGGSRRYG